ncbi:hypothetical protein [Nocardia sp. NRRL S-836]|uniref:hypothetical protein n=1 Tax=Nocardia sp. NRRL S-836 TaxID=1519492 RepID=UPI0006AF1DE4|nr:hypothetical protein [Nocardia sp. NRRL S-836]KOV89091.1 hypothetical protein ADL03_04040 [Nocardia sp. NRRL S-836]
MAVLGVVSLALHVYSSFEESNPEELLAREVEKSKNRLKERATDGVLTNEEIMRSTARDSDGDPRVRQDDTAMHFDSPVAVNVGTALGSRGALRCYTFTITKPLSPLSTVTAVELASCPSPDGGGN